MKKVLHIFIKSTKGLIPLKAGMQIITVLLFLFALGSSVSVLAQTGECLGGGCADGGSQYPAGTFTPTTSWQTAVGMYAGEWQLFNVTSGNIYEFSLCAADGGSCSYDGQLTLRNNAGLALLCYSDDYCGDDPKIMWTATFTGVVRTRVNLYDCTTNSTSTTLAYRYTGAGALPGENCTNAQDLSTLTSPYSATTIGYADDIAVCRTGYPDRIFYISVPDGYIIDIWESTNNYDEYEYMGYGSTCPGSTTINCWDNDALAHNTWTNTTGSTQTVWYVQDAYSGSGTFTLNWTLTAPPVCDNCSNAIVVNIPADLPYSDISQTNCGSCNDHSTGCLGSYDGGEDIFYELNVTSGTTVDITLDPNATTYTGFLLDNSCPDDGTCIDQSTNSGASPHGMTSVSLSAGTYYIMIDTWPAPDCIPDFDLTITAGCSAPSAPSWCNTSIGTPANGLEHHLDLSYENVTGEDGYDIDYSYDGSTWSDLTEATGTSWDINFGDQPNVSVYFRVRAYACSPRQNSGWSYSSPYPIYTACDDPASPTVNTPTTTTLNVTINTETPVANPAITTYSIYCTTTSQYVQASGALGAGEVFQTKAVWGTKTVTGLTCNTAYTFYVKARNNDGDVRYNAANTGSGTTSACCDDCSNAIVVNIPADLPYSDITQTNCGSCNDHSTGCLGSYDGGEDIFYELNVTSGTTVDITLDPNATTYTGFLLDNSCPDDGTCIATSTNSSASPHGLTGVTLSAGTYYIMVDTWTPPDCIPDFDLTITENLAPANDDCPDAINLTVGTSCSYTSGTTTDATDGGVSGCAGTADDDVWYKFTANNTNQTIVVAGSASFDAVIDLRSGACNGTNVWCEDDFSDGGTETAALTGFVVNDVYYIRVYHYGAGSGSGNFDICVYGPADPCASVTSIGGCGAGFTQTYSESGTGAWDLTDCYFFGTPGMEKVYSFVAPTTGTYSIEVTSADGTYLDYFWLASSCASTGWTCIDDISSVGTYGSMSWTASTTYYILLDDENSTASAHQFYINCPSTGTGADDAWPGLDLGPLSCPSTNNYSDNTTSAIDDCSWQIGGDHIYQFSISVVADITIDLCGSSFDTKLYIYEISAGSCDGSDYIAYNDDDCGLQSSVTMNSLAAGTYVIVIEGYLGAEGAYDLTIDISNCGGSCPDCTNGIKDCEEDGVDCGGPDCPPCTGWLHPTTGRQNTYNGACMVNTCGGKYYDDGGSGGNYSNSIGNLNPGPIGIYRIFCPDAAGMAVKATFLDFQIEDDGLGGCYDLITIRNGPTQYSPIIEWGCGDGFLPGPYTSTDPSGCLTFEFYSDGVNTERGWDITLSCTPFGGGPNGTDMNDCVNACEVCNNFDFSGASTGPGIISDGCDGCNLSEHFTNWYTLNIHSSGTLAMTIDPADNIDDYDFALYKAYDCDNLGTPVRCSYAWDFYNIDPNNNTGMVNGAGDNSEDVEGDSWVEDLAVTEGEQYFLMVNKWTPGGAGFDVIWDLTGGASLGAIPKIVSATNGGTNTFEVEISVAVVCTTIAPDGSDFALDCVGSSTILDCQANSIVSATPMNCANDTTRWILITLANPFPTAKAAYENDWKIVCSGSGIVDICGNLLGPDASGGSSDIVLPIELLYFDAKCNETTIALYWSTATEVNNDYFTIQRSTNGLTFESIATVNGAGNSIHTINYYYVDENPVNGTSYYRLKQTDYNGISSYYDIIAVNCESRMSDFSIKPNPAKDVLIVTFNQTSDSDAIIKIYDLRSKLIYSKRFKTTKGTNHINLDVEKYSKGTYFIHLINSDVYQALFIKK